jgi:D-erythrose 4-phosphate dehydrogenase
MNIRIAINGFGRIGRCILRALYESSNRENLKIVAINELSDIENIFHLTKYDSTHGRFPGSIDYKKNKLLINGDIIQVISQKEICRLPWEKLGVDVVLECTGSYGERKIAEQHIFRGAKKIIFSQPAESNIDATIIYGINDDTLKKDDKIISNGSCTSNCLVPVLKIIDDEFGVDFGMITTIHSLMNDQPVIDSYHKQDIRKARSSVKSVIPVATELGKGVARILPHLEGRIEAIALRVPIVNVSLMDITLTVLKDADVDAVNTIFQKNTKGPLEGILGYTEEPLVSCDINHDSRSAIIDGNYTRVSNRRIVKVLAWFDNEWGFANRMLDTTLALMKV